MAKGFVYVLTNAAMPGMVKIGFTMKMPTERAAELSTTGVPQPFEVEYYCLVEEPASLEAQVHRAMAAARQNADREFFKASVAEAVSGILASAKSVEHSWSRAPLARPRPPRVDCRECGAYYVVAETCPKCRIRLTW